MDTYEKVNRAIYDELRELRIYIVIKSVACRAYITISSDSNIFRGYKMQAHEAENLIYSTALLLSMNAEIS